MSPPLGSFSGDNFQSQDLQFLVETDVDPRSCGDIMIVISVAGVPGHSLRDQVPARDRPITDHLCITSERIPNSQSYGFIIDILWFETYLLRKSRITY